ncbi:SDR family NAD(P)-dependent oxidoreductase [Anaplasmataceae bacterium AB001_6]|nr:SDR family NAD(P)-dependent oxidoreductase [Anaplasmataceae bacterium AB001_6]
MYALITGGTSNLGQSIAISLAKKGYNIILHYYRSGDKASALKTFITQKYNVQCYVICRDLLDDQCDIIDNLSAFANDGIIPSVLINNASIFYPQSFEDIKMKDFDAFFMIHVKIPILLSKFLLKKNTKYKVKIINMCDRMVLRKDIKKYFTYTLSKKTLFNFGEMIESLSDRITISAILPNKVKLDEDRFEEYLPLANIIDTILNRNCAQRIFHLD